MARSEPRRCGPPVSSVSTSGDVPPSHVGGGRARAVTERSHSSDAAQQPFTGGRSGTKRLGNIVLLRSAPVTTTRALAGLTIGITADRRAAEQAQLLEQRGAKVVHGP